MLAGLTEWHVQGVGQTCGVYSSRRLLVCIRGSIFAVVVGVAIAGALVSLEDAFGS